MSTKGKFVSATVTVCLCIAVILGFVYVAFILDFGRHLDQQENIRKNAYQYNVDHAVKFSGENDINFNEYIDFLEYKFENGETYIQTNYNNRLVEEKTDEHLRVNKYFCDESIIFTDGNNNYFYTDDETNLYYFMKIKDDNSSDFYIKSDYVFPSVAKNKVVSLLVYEKIDVPEFLNGINSDDFSKCIKITEAEAIKKAVDIFNSGHSDYNWLSKYFDCSADRDYLILAQFENSVVYQTLGRIKVDINNIKSELKSNAWTDLCRFRNEEEWNIDNCMFITHKDCYKVVFFNNEDTSSYHVKLDKITFRSIDDGSL